MRVEYEWDGRKQSLLVAPSRIKEKDFDTHQIRT